MKAQLLAWWQARPERDRHILLIGGAALAALLVLSLGVLPLIDQHRTLRARLPLLRGSTLQLEAQAAEAQQLRAQVGDVNPAGSTVAPMSAASVEASARTAGLRTGMDSFRSVGEGRLEFTMANASFDQVLDWLGRLRRDNGVRVQAMQADAADQPGTVKLKVQLILP